VGSLKVTMAPSAFVQNPEMTAIAIAYKNPDVVLIADGVSPRFSVGGMLFS